MDAKTREGALLEQAPLPDRFAEFADLFEREGIIVRAVDEDLAIYASIDPTRLSDDELLTDPDTKEAYKKDIISRRLAGEDSGQITDVVVAVVPGQDRLFIIDGLHRRQGVEEANIAASEIDGLESFDLNICIKYIADMDELCKERILASLGKDKVNFARAVSLVEAAWEDTPWSKLLSVRQAFSIDKLSAEALEKLEINSTTLAAMQDWIEARGESWGLEKIRELLKDSSGVDSELVKNARTNQNKREQPEGALTPKQVKLLSRYAPDNVPIQWRIYQFLQEAESKPSDADLELFLGYYKSCQDTLDDRDLISLGEFEPLINDWSAIVDTQKELKVQAKRSKTVDNANRKVLAAIETADTLEDLELLRELATNWLGEIGVRLAESRANGEPDELPEEEAPQKTDKDETLPSSAVDTESSETADADPADTLDDDADSELPSFADYFTEHIDVSDNQEVRRQALLLIWGVGDLGNLPISCTRTEIRKIRSDITKLEATYNLSAQEKERIRLLLEELDAMSDDLKRSRR